MGDVATAMRDPIFYRWHAFIDNMFQQFKDTLPRYTEKQVKSPKSTVIPIIIFMKYSTLLQR